MDPGGWCPSKVSFRPGFGTTISPSLVPKKHELLKTICITCKSNNDWPKIVVLSSWFQNKLKLELKGPGGKVAVGNSTPFRRSTGRPQGGYVAKNPLAEVIWGTRWQREQPKAECEPLKGTQVAQLQSGS